MYWYISFLRPPPVGISLPSEGVVITPQVANDLRTELRDEPTPISYIWHRLSPSPTTMAPAELTIFEPPASTYRPLTIPLPRTARPGDKWRLGLFSPPSELESPLLSLSEPSVPVMGVWSEAIELRRGAEPSSSGPVRGVGADKGKGKGKKEDKEKRNGKGKGKEKEKEEAKQTRITRAWPLPLPGGELKLVEQTSFDLDKKVWDSGLALASWLWRWMPEGRSKHENALARTVLSRLRGARSVELGSGTGLVAIALALLDPSASITATDLDSAMEIMAENVALNAVQYRVRADVLDWDAPLPAWAEGTPMVIAADVTYNTASFPALVATLERLLKPEQSGGDKPLLLLAYKQRDAAERDLWAMLSERGIGTVMVDKVRGAEEEGQVEIWVAGVGVRVGVE